jgi:putative ABC transport system permease protein
LPQTSRRERPSRLRLADLPRVGSAGLRTRRLRAALSALGVAIGIASMVAVLGISASSRADLLARLDALGTNLLTVAPGQDFFGTDSTLPSTARAMVARIGAVDRAAAVTDVDATVRKSDYVPSEETGGIVVQAASPGLLRTLDGRMRSGRFLDRALERYPAVVLGSLAARRLGIDEARGAPRVWLGDHWFTVAGILAPLPLAPELDRAALVGYPVAAELFGTERHASKVYVRADPDRVAAARALLPATANPESPSEVDVSRPSDGLAARAAARDAFTTLFLGLGAVALVVGGVGIANVMVVSVLERRPEIGLRRAIGARRRHIAAQFLVESLLLSSLGGVAGAALGAAVTAGYAASQGWVLVVPAAALAGGAGAALLVGAVAGLYPALRAARLSPTDALRSG